MAAPSQQQQDQSIGQLVSSAVADVKTLVNDQVELTKAELRDSAKKAGSAFGLFAAAGVLGFLCFVFLLVTLAYVLVQLGLPVWAGFGIVTLLLAIVAAILGILGKKRADRVKGPQESMAQLQATKAALTSGSPKQITSG
jgi:hypothetical protein